MVGLNTRQRFASIVQYKRKMIKMDQKTFGGKIWPDISPATAQSRISRLERADFWPVIADMLKIIEALDLWDNILDLESISQMEDFIILDPACRKFIPNLSYLAEMMSNHAKDSDPEKFYAVIRLLCDLSYSQEEKLKAK